MLRVLIKKNRLVIIGDSSSNQKHEAGEENKSNKWNLQYLMDKNLMK